MERRGIYRVLENRTVYRLSQWILAPGAAWALRRRVEGQLRRAQAEGLRVLELGCGTGTFSARGNVFYVGSDINDRYFPPPDARRSRRFAAMDATRLALRDAQFDVVYSCALYHHLDDANVRTSLAQSLRVLKPGGRLIWIDNIWPTCRLNLLAWTLRRLDRGRFVRSAAEIARIIDAMPVQVVSTATFYYSLTGLQAIVIEAMKR